MNHGAEKITLRKATETIGGLKYVTDSMEMLSGPGRRQLLSLPYLTSAALIERELEATEEISSLLAAPESTRVMDSICLQLMQLRDVRGTIKALEQRNVMDDIQLYELKALALIASAVKAQADNVGLESVVIPSVETVIGLLDPEGQQVASFHVYDSYSPLLRQLREELKSLRTRGPEEEAEKTYLRSLEEEDKVREWLSRQLQPHARALGDALEALGRLDLLIARARLKESLSLCRPVHDTEQTEYRGLVNPQVAAALKERHRRFQPVDLVITRGITIITGANMAGKSVVLKTAALAQAMYQFGFHVPAASASIRPVDEILLCTGDGQDELSGLSSFAAEMLKINSIIKKIKGGSDALALIDEPARTTNPVEGKALVSAIADFLRSHGTQSLLTTHYSGINVACRRLRVKGLRKDAERTGITAGQLDDCIDYSLEPDTMGEVPHEALRIARMLGVEEEITRGASAYLEKF